MLALGMTSEIYLLEPMLRVGVVSDTNERLNRLVIRVATMGADHFRI